MNDERREYQRLNLTEPLDAWFGDFTVRLVEVSMAGAQIEHDEPIPQGARGQLRFYFRGTEVEILSVTARLIEPGRSGLHFLEESEMLRALIVASAADMIRAIEANARGDRAANVIGDETLTAAWHRPIAGFVEWTFDDGRWSARPCRVCDQPENGFTISAAEAEDQVELLRRTYESGDDEARQMTRTLAELSITRIG
ncbi:MAG TPA: PilZ domain-containing protein [Thermoanaerobaculia bacterium]|nr:PilZ domain-containing protein [Thermoanaerobaculia bacterium]